MTWIILEWISTLASFVGTGLIAKHIHCGWLICVVADIGFVVFSIHRKLWAFLTLCSVYTILNLVGWLS